MGALLGNGDTENGEQEWTDTTWEEYPYMVRVQSQKNQASLTGFNVCGGSILTTNGNNGKAVILTAAHCVDDTTKIAKVYVGQTYTWSADWLDLGLYVTGDGESFTAASVTVHPDYVHADTDNSASEWLNNDIALIYLKTNIDYRGATAIQLHPAGHYVGTGSRVLALGYYGTGSSDTDRLEYMYSHLLSESECQKTFGDKTVGDEDFCVNDQDHSDGNTETSSGDSGSPIVYNNRQLGLVSYSISDGNTDDASGMTNVTHYVDWIKSECPQCFNYAASYTSQYYGCGGLSNWWQGCRGTDYSIAAPSGQYIAELCVSNGAEIDAIQARFTDGSWSSKYGGSGGARECYNAGQRCFTSVEIKSGDTVDSLQFTLSDLEKTSKFGGSGGNGPFRENSKVFGYCLSGMKFRAKDTVNRIQFTWSAVDMDQVAQSLEFDDGVASGDNITVVVVAIVLAVVAVLALVVGCILCRCRNKKKKDALLNEANEEAVIEVDVELSM